MHRALIVCLLLTAPLATRAQQSREEITVERILVDARVTSYNGDPVLGLDVDDFVVKLDGRKAQIESVLWVPENAAQRAIAGIDESDAPCGADGAHDCASPAGRLLVFFIQTDFGRAASRVGGQMHFLPGVEKILDGLEPEDRVAVLSFDSHLKFRLDFSKERATIMHAVRSALAIDDPPPPPIVPNPSLARRLDREEMRKAASSEAGLILVANALRPIAGPKSLLLLGWGLGEYRGGEVVMTHKYAIARRALEASRVTIFSLDTTLADYHTLEVGLKQAAADTGGFYAKTHDFPQQAIDRLHKTLAGHYELEVRRPEGLARGTHTIDVSVKKRGTYVMARRSWIDR